MSNLPANLPPYLPTQASRHLIVKLSSLGDVIHALPIVADVAHFRPDIALDWVTEAPYVDLLKLHSGLRQIFGVSLRQLKRQPFSLANWRALMAQRRAIRQTEYLGVLDCQGLLKSAWVANWNAAPCAGLGPMTIREPLAARFYNQRFEVSRELHAVTRNRQLAAAAFGYTVTNTDAPNYGLMASPSASFTQPYVVFLHATSRDDKCWPEKNWIALGNALQQRGYNVVLPWGNEIERARSQRLAAAFMNAVIPDKLSLSAAASLLQGAAAVVGVDTGLAHLAVALGRPTVGLYLSTQPALTGLFPESTQVVNLGGGSRDTPTLLDGGLVLETVLRVLS
jgi:heptosyltransferase I